MSNEISKMHRVCALGIAIFSMVIISCPTPVADIPVTGVSLDKSEAVLAAGNTVQLTAVIVPDDATNKNLEWVSSDDSIATVDAE